MYSGNFECQNQGALKTCIYVGRERTKRKGNENGRDREENVCKTSGHRNLKIDELKFIGIVQA